MGGRAGQRKAVGGGRRKGGGATDGWLSGAEEGDLGEKTEAAREAGRPRAAKTCGRGAGCKENRIGGLVLQRKVTLVTNVWAFEHLGLQVSRLFYLIR
jgi:hypothetical protein